MWQPIETVPNGIPVLVWLEEPSLGCQVHGAIFRPNGSIIGHHFSYDVPKPTHWMLPPDSPKKK